MFSALPQQPEDKILGLMKKFREDPRADKIDLGVGVYRNAEGVTPIMKAVKTAEQKIWEAQDTKAYTGLAGTPEYNAAMADMILADSAPDGGVASVATPGGTGAIRQAFELIKMANAEATVWYSDPTWGNHVSILKYVGLKHQAYRYLDRATSTVDFDGMMADLDTAKDGDIILLHGCCHNPTGANLTQDQWQAVIDVMNRRGLKPMIDLAYQGFGEGLEEDAAATRLVVANAPETLVAASCSKNFGIYRERTGILMAAAHDKGLKALTQSNLAFLNRQNYSFPPDHGARIVSTILEDQALRADWKAELDEVRGGMLKLRSALAAELKRVTNSDRFDFLDQHRGMFSMLGITPEQVDRLREEHAIYLIRDSRMNIAGLNDKTIPVLAGAVASVLTSES